MKRFPCLLFLFLFSAPLFGQSGEGLRAEIEKLIHFETDINFKTTPGFIIGVVDGDSTYILPFGSLRTDTFLPPNEKTIFELGGLTNVFTATLISIMAEQGKILLDAPLGNYLSPFEKNETAAHLTVLNFLTHTTGLPRLPFGIGRKEQDPDQPFANYSPDDFAEFYRNFLFDAKPSRYNFSNVNYALLERAVENVIGQSYEVWLQHEVLRPLEMSDTRVHLTKEQTSRLAPGYDKAMNIAPAWQFKSFKGAVGLKSSMHDLLIFLKANLNPPDGFFPPPLGKDGKGIHPTGIRKDTWIAAGWHVIRKKKKRPPVITHTGATSGHRATMAFVIEKKKGVVILANSPLSLDGLEYLVLDLLDSKKSKSSWKN